MKELDDGFISKLVEKFSEVPSIHTILTFDHLHGAVFNYDEKQSSFGHRGYKHLFLINTNWLIASQDKKNITWTKDMFVELDLDENSQSYINYLGFDESERVCTSFVNPINKRLKDVRLKYDQDELFQTYLNN